MPWCCATSLLAAGFLLGAATTGIAVLVTRSFGEAAAPEPRVDFDFAVKGIQTPRQHNKMTGMQACLNALLCGIAKRGIRGSSKTHCDLEKDEVGC